MDKRNFIKLSAAMLATPFGFAASGGPARRPAIALQNRRGRKVGAQGRAGPGRGPGGPPAWAVPRSLAAAYSRDSDNRGLAVTLEGLAGGLSQVVGRDHR